MAATTPLTYNAFVTQLCTMAVVPYSTVNGIVVPSDANLATIMPMVLNYAELRIQRDLDFLQAQIFDNTSYTTGVSNNQLVISFQQFIILKTLGIYVGTVFQQLLPVSIEYIQTVWPDSSVLGPPVCFAMTGDLTAGADAGIYVTLGPYPDQSYPVGVRGVARLPTLYTQSSTAASGNYTLISTYFPDLLMMASMIYVSAYQRNFSATSDQPDMGVNYETQYQALLQGAKTEEERKRFQASAWTSSAPPVVATPTRG